MDRKVKSSTVSLWLSPPTASRPIERLPSWSFRVHAYAGIDPVTGKPRRLKQTCPDEAAAAAALGQLLSPADGHRFPNPEAILAQAIDRFPKVADVEVSTREAHKGYVRRTIGPVLGEVKIRKLSPETTPPEPAGRGSTGLSSCGQGDSCGARPSLNAKNGHLPS